MKTALTLILALLFILPVMAQEEKVNVDGDNLIEYFEDLASPMIEDGMDNCEVRFYVLRNVIVNGTKAIVSSITKSDNDDEDFNLKLGMVCKNGKEKLRIVGVVDAKNEKVTIKRIKIVAKNITLE